MPTETHIINLDNIAEKRAVLSRIGILRGKWRLELSRYRETRSAAQNRYYFGVIVRAFYEFLREQDYQISRPEHAHQLLAAKFLTVEIPNPQTGELMPMVRSTKELSVAEFADYLTRCRAWLSDFFSIILPDDPSLSDPQPIREAGNGQGY